MGRKRVITEGRIPGKYSSVKQSHGRQRFRQRAEYAFLTLLFMIAIAAGYSLTPGSGAGFGAATQFMTSEYSDNIDHTFTHAFTDSDSHNIYTWIPEHTGEIRSIKVSGTLKGDGNAALYLEKDGKRYSIITEKEINKQGTSTFIADIPEESADEDAEPGESEESTDETETDNESEEIDRTISIDLKYRSDSDWGNNRGAATLEGIIDFTVEGTGFSWDIDESKLCTIWKVDSNDGDSTAICNGDDDCCAFSQLLPSGKEWLSPFELYFGRYSAGFENEVSAQVMYANYSLDAENIYSDIVRSDWASLPARFVNTTVEVIEFNKLCSKTCFVRNYDDESFSLVAEVDEGTELVIEKISYTMRSGSSDQTNASVGDRKISLRVENSRKDRVNTKIRIYKDKVKLRDLDGEDDAILDKGEYDIEIIPENSSVVNITLNDVDVTENTTDFLRIDEVSPDKITEKEFVKVYAIDPTPINFSEGNVTVTAEGTDLYKCKEWNFSEQRCDGEWTRLMNLTPGENYTFTLTPDDPGFGESITILNVQSYPIVGGNWTVEFTTRGRANLTITAVNGTTWSDGNETEDLKFLVLKCGNNTQNYTWVNGSVFIPDYRCRDTGTETSKVLTEGSHHLRFQFGEEVEYAHNLASGDVIYMYPDIAAPGMNVLVTFVDLNNSVFNNSIVITTNSSDVTVGPVVVTNRAGNVVTTGGDALSVPFFISPTAATQTVQISMGATALSQIFY
ncbi:MAG: hypothetical protein KKE20_01580, partial [Nanoarchaeota archaeon]|nr:hypothetical protein [Nanoarchaeota archaeon]